MPRFTVLGAGGFIGHHLVPFLRDQDDVVDAPARDAPWPEGEVGHVIYCVGLTGDFPKRPLDTADAHVGRLSQFLRTARPASVTYLSSTRLYDGGEGLARETDAVTLDPSRRRHLYHLTKAAGEAVTLSGVCRNGRVARLGCVYSDDLGDDSFLHDVIGRAVSHASITVMAAPDIARDYIHVADVCAALRAIALDGKRPIYNVAGGVNVANRELFAWLSEMSGCRIRAIGEVTSETAPMIDISALRDDFGLRPRRLRSALSDILAAHGVQPRHLAAG